MYGVVRACGVCAPDRVCGGVSASTASVIHLIRKTVRAKGRMFLRMHALHKRPSISSDESGIAAVVSVMVSLMMLVWRAGVTRWTAAQHGQRVSTLLLVRGWGDAYP